MTHFPILYHWGADINQKTAMEEGHFYDDGQQLIIKEKSGIFIKVENVNNTEIYKYEYLGAGVKTEINYREIIITVPIIHLNIGKSGLGLNSIEKTMKLEKILKSRENAR